MENRKAALSAMDRLSVPYTLAEYPAVYTIEEMESLNITQSGHVCKNLCLRDAKGKNHYLIVLAQEKKADIKSIAAQLGTTNLNFASEDRLMALWGLRRARYTPGGNQ